MRVFPDEIHAFKEKISTEILLVMRRREKPEKKERKAFHLIEPGEETIFRYNFMDILCLKRASIFGQRWAEKCKMRVQSINIICPFNHNEFLLAFQVCIELDRYIYIHT